MIEAIAIGILKAVRDTDEWNRSGSWLHRIGWVKRWSETNRKLVVFPLDLWHAVEVAILVILMGWWAFVALAVFTLFYHFLLRRVPFKGLAEWWRKLFICKEDFTI